MELNFALDFKISIFSCTLSGNILRALTGCVIQETFSENLYSSVLPVCSQQVASVFPAVFQKLCTSNDFLKYVNR